MKKTILITLTLCAILITMAGSSLAAEFRFNGHVVCDEGGVIPGEHVHIDWLQWYGDGGSGSQDLYTDQDGAWSKRISNGFPYFGWFNVTVNHVTHTFVWPQDFEEISPGVYQCYTHHRRDCIDTTNDMQNLPGNKSATENKTFDSVKAQYR